MVALKNKLRHSLKGLIIFLLLPLGVYTLSACANGKNTQTADQVAAVNGASAHKGDIDLQNVYFRKTNNNTYELVMTAVNNNLTTDDKLVEINSADGIKFTIAGQTTVPAQGLLQAGTPENSLINPSQINMARINGIYNEDNNNKISVTAGADRIKPGLTNELTFGFQNAGVITLGVPLVVAEPNS